MCFRTISPLISWVLGLTYLLIAGTILSFVGCTSTSPTPQPDSSATTIRRTETPRATITRRPTSTPAPTPTRTVIDSADTTISVWTNLPEAQIKLLNQDIEQFHTQFSQHHIELKNYDVPQDLLANRTEFDVALVASPVLAQLRNNGLIGPMSDFFPPSFVDAFAAVTLQGATQKDALWGLPDTAGFHLLLFYNLDLVDTPPASTREMVTLAQELTDDSQWGLALNSYDPLWLLPWLNANEGWIVDETGQPTLNTSAMESTLTLYLDWHNHQIIPLETYDDVRDRFLNGDVALMIDGEWTIGELANSDKVNWAVTLLPNVEQTQTSEAAAPLVLARYWVISRNTTGDQAAAATAFLEFITDPDRQLARTTQFGLLPTRREALNDPLILNDPALRVSTVQMQAGRAVPLGVNVNFILDAMREPLQRALDGELTPSEAAELMQANVEK